MRGMLKRERGRRPFAGRFATGFERAVKAACLRLQRAGFAACGSLHLRLTAQIARPRCQLFSLLCPCCFFRPVHRLPFFFRHTSAANGSLNFWMGQQMRITGNDWQSNVRLWTKTGRTESLAGYRQLPAAESQGAGVVKINCRTNCKTGVAALFRHSKNTFTVW